MKPLSAFLLLTGALASLLSGCSRADAEKRAGLPPTPVVVAAVVERTEPRIVSIPGETRAAERALLAAKIAGGVQEISVKLGQTVRAGEVLIRLSAPEYVAQAERARTDLAQAERELGRDRQLLAARVAADDTVRSGEERVRSARASVAEAEAMLAYTEIRAPFDGRVAVRQAGLGDLVLPGQPLLALDLAGPLEVLTPVPASLAGALSPGTTVRVRNGSEVAEAVVSEIAAAADAATRSIAAVLTLAGETGWPAGQFVAVELPAGEETRRLVPASAVRPFGQVESVLVVSNNRLQLRLVRTGRAAGEWVEILAGVEPGERVVAAPAATLRDGQPVEVSP